MYLLIEGSRTGRFFSCIREDNSRLGQEVWQEHGAFPSFADDSPGWLGASAHEEVLVCSWNGLPEEWTSRGGVAALPGAERFLLLSPAETAALAASIARQPGVEAAVCVVVAESQGVFGTCVSGRLLRRSGRRPSNPADLHVPDCRYGGIEIGRNLQRIAQQAAVLLDVLNPASFHFFSVDTEFAPDQRQSIMEILKQEVLASTLDACEMEFAQMTDERLRRDMGLVADYLQAAAKGMDIRHALFS